MNLLYQIISPKLAKKAFIYQLIIVMLAGILAPFSQVLAATTDPLVISDITVSRNDANATISWRTNRPTFGKIEYGLFPNDYNWTVQTNQKKTEQSITIFGLFSETDYFFRITADDESSEVISFEQSFKTLKIGNNKAPTISDVQVAYTTGNTATIQWLTDEPATSEVSYGLTENYNLAKNDGRRVKVHDVTLTGLVDGTFYHFRVQSKDEDNNVSRWFDMTFRTKLTNVSDRDELIIYNITPVSENDINVTDTTAVITWRTNKLAEGWVRYGSAPRTGPSVKSNPPRDFFQSITLTGLNPGTVYYFDILAKDVTNKEVRSDTFSFRTKSNSGQSAAGQNPTTGYTGYQAYTGGGQVLGAATCSVNLNSDFGYSGYYYNLSESHPDMQLPANTAWTKIGRENDWYDSQYFSFERIDPNLLFRGSRFFPVNDGKPGDPSYFAVNWRAIMEVPTDGLYSYTISSDDDSWLFVNDQLENDFGGISVHGPTTKEIYLTAGLHKVEIFYADRRKLGASFVFEPETRLKFHPLPAGCGVGDVLNYTNNPNAYAGNQGGSLGPVGGDGGGVVLGVSNFDSSQTTYVCNPNLGYTKFKALYKTTESPDIWALLETGQKHYITSPEAFNKYQCDWSQVQVVSKKFLNGFANANLVRTPADPVIYHLFQRPETKWLKINIPSPTTFVSYASNFWGNVARVDVLDIQSYPDAQLIKAMGDPKVYLIEGKLKRYITAEEVFERIGYDWAEVVEISQIHLDSFEDGPVID